MLISSSFSARASCRGRAGGTVGGGFVRRTVASFLQRDLRICFVRGGVSTTGLYRRILVGGHDHRGTRAAHLGLGGALRDNGSVTSHIPNFISYHAGSITHHRLFVIRNGSTVNTYVRTHSTRFRTVVPVHNGVLGYLGTRFSGVFGDRVVIGLLGVVNYNIRIHSGTGGGLTAFSLGRLHFGGVVVYASTSISNFRVHALILTVLCHLAPALVRRNCICVTRAPLCRVGAGASACFTCGRLRGAGVLRRVSNRGFAVRQSGKLNRGRTSVVSLAAVGPTAHHLIGIGPASTLRATRIFSILLNSSLSNHGHVVTRRNRRCLSVLSLRWREDSAG